MRADELDARLLSAQASLGRWARPPVRRARRSRWRSGVVALCASLAACGDSGTGPQGRAVAVAVVEPFTGTGQRGLAGQPLPESVVVRLLDAGGSPVARATVTFAPAEGHGAVLPWAARSDSAGLAATRWTLGDATGEQVLTATVRDGVSTAVRATAVTVLPDLVAVLSPGDARTWPGGSFEYVAAYRNLGDTAAAATRARAFVSTDAVITTSDEVVGGPFDVPALGPGESASRTSSFTVNSSSAPGTVLYLGQCVDPLEWESDTGNNCSAAIRVTVTAGPDLVVDMSRDSVTVAPGDRFRFSVTIRNQGESDAAATRMRTFESADTAITTSDNEISSPADVPALAPGEFARGRATVTLSGSASPGTVLHLGQCVDAVPGESDTGNNCSNALTIVVRAADGDAGHAASQARSARPDSAAGPVMRVHHSRFFIRKEGHQ